MLKNEITAAEIKKIFRNKDNKLIYLSKYFKRIGCKDTLAKSAAKIDAQIIETWNYDISKSVIREMFRETDKYTYMSTCKQRINKSIEEWKALGLGGIEWPFSAMNFDQHVHRLNRNEDITEEAKDKILSREAIMFRRIKQMNAFRNDYIEYLIFQNENVIPTFGNNRGVDFYIDGNPYDQKVAKSVGKVFQQKYGDEYRDKAIHSPELVAKSLYENQDEERFGDESRLLIIYLDSDINAEQIEEQLKNVDFNEPMQIEFKYKHSNNNVLSHSAECFVILLHH